MALTNLDRNKEAISSFDRALQRDPEYKSAKEYRAIVLKKLGRY